MACSPTVSNLMTQPRSTTDANNSYEILRRAVSDHISKFELQCHSIFELLTEENERLKTSLTISNSMHMSEHAGSKINTSQRSWDLEMPLTPCLPLVPVEPPLPARGRSLTPRGSRPLTPKGARRLTPKSRQASSQVARNEYKRLATNDDGSLENQNASWQPLTPKPNEDEEIFRTTSMKSSGSEAMGIISEVFENSTVRVPRNSGGSQENVSESVLANWERMFTNICIPKEERTWLKVKEMGGDDHTLHRVWTFRKVGSIDTIVSTQEAPAQEVTTQLTDASQGQSSFIYNDFGLRVGKVVKSRNSCIKVVHPENRYCILHTLMQGALILFDVVDFPLLAFRTGQPDHADTMLIISIFFWTWDMIFSFLTGFVSPTGIIEMRPSKIARNYFRSWFMFDFIVVVFDWVSFVAFIMQQTMGKESNLARTSKLGKVQRLARGGRILRLAKIVEKMHAALDGNASAESIIIMAKIVGLLFLIILINHYVASAWYAIADGSDREDTWIKEKGILDYDIFDRYFYSLHWSLTQFTPCTNDISPSNGQERAFACLVVIVALVTFSTFLSSLTSATMQIKQLNWEQYSEQVQIRDFMHAKQVPTTVAQRVWQYYRKQYRLRNRSIVESDVHFFQVMPRSLRKELLCHAYIPTLIHHPVMRQLILDPKDSMGPMLCGTVSILIPFSGQDIFLEGEEAAHMYYFVNGNGTYIFWGGSRMLSAPDHLTEAALWLSDWQHPGRLTATNNRCELLLLSSARFTSCMDRQAHPRTVRHLTKYASLFAQYQHDLQSDELQEVRQLHPSASQPFVDSKSSFSPFVDSNSRKDRRPGSADLALPPSVHAELIGKAFPSLALSNSLLSLGHSFSRVSRISHSLSGSCPSCEAFKFGFVRVMHKFGSLFDLRKSSTR